MPTFTDLLAQGAAHAWLFIPSAILLGALHGLEPGHSKTMMAAFIVAIRGSVKQAILLGHRGIRGLVVCCEDCKQDHYHDWDMLRANLLQLLVDGTVRPHEPAYDPQPDAYVTWDYCRGYADASMNGALSDGGYDN